MHIDRQAARVLGTALCALCTFAGTAGEVVELRNAGFEETGKNKYPVG